MEESIRFDYSHAAPFLLPDEWEPYADAVKLAHHMLHNKTGPGHEWLGWVDWPIRCDQAEVLKIKEAAAQIRHDSDVLLIIGIGGSYLGAKAVLDIVGHTFSNTLQRDRRQAPEVYFVGNQLSAGYLNHLLDIIDGKDVSINVISKSGTTIEPAIAFRLFRDYLQKKYGAAGAQKRIYATTDASTGALSKLAVEAGYPRFDIPRDIGGRFSVLTAVGLLPTAAAGGDIDALLLGAAHAHAEYRTPELQKNPCYQYAVARNLLYRKGKLIELFVGYEPQQRFFAEWWKQLFSESEGKSGQGIFPATGAFSTDLHSLGQYIQEGSRHLFETVLWVDEPESDVMIGEDPADVDGLNFLAGKGIDYVNEKAFEAALLAHVDGGVPNLVLTLPRQSAYYLGRLIYFFEKACGISGYLMGVNPFDQPGVDAYKENMFALLGKPGYEQQKMELEARINRRS